MACAAPHSPMRTPSRLRRPSVASCIIEPMAAIENAPLATPSTNTLAGSGQAGAHQPASHQPGQRQRRGQAAADRPAAQLPKPMPRQRRPASAASSMPGQHAAVLQARQLVDSARRVAEHRAGEGLEDQVLRAVGQHRHEDEDREAARVGSAHTCAQRLAEGPRGVGRRRPGPGPGLPAPQRQHGDQPGQHRHRPPSRPPAARANRGRAAGR
jgi:hypothetical protein